jgi:hypothetical protein
MTQRDNPRSPWLRRDDTTSPVPLRVHQRRRVPHPCRRQRWGLVGFVRCGMRCSNRRALCRTYGARCRYLSRSQPFRAGLTSDAPTALGCVRFLSAREPHIWRPKRHSAELSAKMRASDAALKAAAHFWASGLATIPMRWGMGILSKEGFRAGLESDSTGKEFLCCSGILFQFGED